MPTQRQYTTPKGFVNEVTTADEYITPMGFMNETTDAAAATFIPQQQKPILQAVNRAATY